MENENQNNAVTQTVDETQNKTEETVTQTDTKTEEKIFTQEEVNRMLAKEKKNMPSKEELKAFNEWKESQKTAEQKQSEKETKYQETLSKNTELERENRVLKAGVNSDDVDYVMFKVSKMDGDFEENLKGFLKDNPKYLVSKKEETSEQEIDLGGKHQDKGIPDLSKMSYEEYKAYRKNNK